MIPFRNIGNSAAASKAKPTQAQIMLCKVHGLHVLRLMENPKYSYDILTGEYTVYIYGAL